MPSTSKEPRTSLSSSTRSAILANRLKYWHNWGRHTKKRVPQGENNPPVVNAALPAVLGPEGI